MHKRLNQFLLERSIANQRWLESLPNVVILTGAGISAESGIKTFRDANGLWENYRIEEVATPEGFANNPQRVQHFYNQRRKQLQQPSLKPNAAHHALAELERMLQHRFLLITQNIDNLHERAGNQCVIHMHGELLKVRCTRSGQIITWTGDVDPYHHCHCCQSPAPIRPHIVWFGEIPLEMDTIYQAIVKADLFIAIGTSGQVYPAAGFVQQAKQFNVQTVELNLEPSQVSDQFDTCHYGLASKIVPTYIRHFINQLNHTKNKVNDNK